MGLPSPKGLVYYGRTGQPKEEEREISDWPCNCIRRTGPLCSVAAYHVKIINKQWPGLQTSMSEYCLSRISEKH